MRSHRAARRLPLLLCLAAAAGCDDGHRAHTWEFEDAALLAPPPPPPPPVRVLHGAVDVRPMSVALGDVPVGALARARISIRNLGEGRLNVLDLELVGATDLGVRFRGRDPAEAPEMLIDPDQDGESGLAPGGEMVVQIAFRPTRPGPAYAELRVLSDDPASSEVRVELAANGAARCAQLAPSALRFGTVAPGDRRPLTAQITSCGARPLRLLSARLDPGSDAGFSLSPAALPTRLPGATPGQAPPTHPLTVVFAPGDRSLARGRVLIRTDDPAQPTLRLGLEGQGAANECPVPRAAQPEVRAAPLDVITLDGGPSTDAEGDIALYEWTVVERPEDSAAHVVERFDEPQHPARGGPDDDPTTPTAQLYADLAGRYVVALRVTDTLQRTTPGSDCPGEGARVIIDAVPTADVHLQLVWDTPGDGYQGDEQGSDLDLHLLRPGGRAWGSDEDCFYGNPTPDWGPAGPAGDPSLDIDDIDGAGPENINLYEPEQTGAGRFLVGVHYFRAEDLSTQLSYGPSRATVRAFLHGRLEAEYSMNLERTGDLWRVAGITVRGDLISLQPDGTVGRLEAP